MGTRVTLTGLIAADGRADVSLPAEAGSDPARPPAVACYTSSSLTSGIWLAVAEGFSTSDSYCVLVLTEGVWRAGIRQGIAGWYAAFAVVY